MKLLLLRARLLHGRVQMYTCVIVVLLLTSKRRGPWATGFTAVEEEGLAASGCCFSGPGTYTGEHKQKQTCPLAAYWVHCIFAKTRMGDYLNNRAEWWWWWWLLPTTLQGVIGQAQWWWVLWWLWWLWWWW